MQLIEGIVLGPDGFPVVDAAVNLFPDPGSRELGRGVFSDDQGRFAFFGVPLGVYSVEVTSPDGLIRTISGQIERAATDIASVNSGEMATTALTRDASQCARASAKHP